MARVSRSFRRARNAYTSLWARLSPEVYSDSSLFLETPERGPACCGRLKVDSPSTGHTHGISLSLSPTNDVRDLDFVNPNLVRGSLSANRVRRSFHYVPIHFATLSAFCVKEIGTKSSSIPDMRALRFRQCGLKEREYSMPQEMPFRL